MSDVRPTDDSSATPVRTIGLAAAIGAWILWSGIVLTGTGAIIWNNVLVGAGIAFFGSYAAAWPDGRRLSPVVAPAIVALLGVWILAAPFVLEVAADRLVWSNIVSGALVAILAGSSVYGSRRLEQSETAGAYSNQ